MKEGDEDIDLMKQRDDGEGTSCCGISGSHRMRNMVDRMVESGTYARFLVSPCPMQLAMRRTCLSLVRKAPITGSSIRSCWSVSQIERGSWDR